MFLFAFLLSFLCGFALHEHPATKPSLIRFTENKNQWEPFIKYRAQLDGGALFLQNNRLTYHFYDKDSYRSIHANPKAKVKEIKRSWFHVNFVNANPFVSYKSISPAPDYSNFFIGNVPGKWASNVKNYEEVIYENIWPQINLQIIGQDNSLKSNFYVSPGGDPSKIQLHYEGVKSIRLKNGRLNIASHINEITEHEPYAYQIIKEIKTEVLCKFKLIENNVVIYDFPKGYDKTVELIIDPVLVFACSSGSTADNFGMTATYDEDGNLYSGGTAFNIGFPTTASAYDQTYSSLVQYGQTDVVITKYDSSGTFLQYSTYLGGADDAEVVNSLIVDAQNNLYMYGLTASPDFPTSASAFDQSFNGGKTVRYYYNGAFFERGTDIFISKLNTSGSALVSSTFIGGSNNDGLNYTVDSTLAAIIAPYGNVYQPNYDSLFFNYGDQNRGEIQLDNAGNVLVASTTRSSDFPTPNSFDNSLNGVQDAVVFKLSSNLDVLMWSSYFGGSNMDAGNALCLDTDNNIFLTGGTCSNDLPITTGAFKPTYGGGKADGYIAKIKADGSVMEHATYIGTTNYDQCYFVQVDNSANVFVFGQTQGTLPVVNAAYSTTNGRQFISKLDSTLGSLLMQTKFGNGSPVINISPSAFLVDCAENIYLSGWGGNIITGLATTNMPLTPNAHQNTTDGFNFYLMVLSKNAGALLYATYFGGAISHEHVDGGTSRFDKKGIIYQSVCAGCATQAAPFNHDDFPVTPGSWPTSLYGNNWNQSSNCNNGTFKFNFEYAIPVAQITSSTVNGCAPLTVSFANTSISAVQYLWDFGNNDTTSLINNPVHTFPTPGTYTVMLLAKNNACFNVWDTAYTIVTVFPKPDALATASIQACTNTWDFASQSVVNPGTLTYAWNFGDSGSSTNQNESHTYGSIGSFTTSLIVTSNNGCKDTVYLPVQTTLQSDSAGPGTTYCPEVVQPYQLHAQGGTSYVWSPATGLNNPNIANPITTTTVATNYSVTISELDGGGNSCSSVQTVSITVHPGVTANFSSAVNNCGNTVQYTNSSLGNPVIWSWNFGDNNFSSAQNPSHSYGLPGTYSVSLAVENTFGCRDTMIQPVTLGGFNPLTINSNQTICYSQLAQLNASGGIAYSWSPAASLNNSSIQNPIASPNVTTTYTVTITTINTLGDTCISNLNTTVNIATLSNTQLTTSANPDTIYAGETSLVNSNVGSPYTIQWSPAYGLSSATAFDPIATPLHTTTYSAIVTDANGCKYLLDTVIIYVLTRQCDEESVFIPNTFSPNSDGSNDILYVRSNFVTDLYFAIYDRWGEKVFETNDITKGWDGMFKGMKSDPGVFGYYLKYTCNNGEESFKKGNVTLIR